jgi:hypothetical protein
MILLIKNFLSMNKIFTKVRQCNYKNKFRKGEDGRVDNSFYSWRFFFRNIPNQPILCLTLYVLNQRGLNILAN